MKCTHTSICNLNVRIGSLDSSPFPNAQCVFKISLSLHVPESTCIDRGFKILEANFYTVAYPYPFRVCPKQFAVLITAMITGRAATFFFCSVLLGCTFLKAMLPTTSNILQALQYKHCDKRLVLYISSLLPSFSLN